MPLADRQSPQESRRKERIPGELLGDSVRQLSRINAIGRERIVAHDGAALVDHHKRRGDSASCVLAGLVVEIIVQFRHAAAERDAIMGRPEWFYAIVGIAHLALV
jgi:hypothetical protein